MQARGCVQHNRWRTAAACRCGGDGTVETRAVRGPIGLENGWAIALGIDRDGDEEHPGAEVGAQAMHAADDEAAEIGDTLARLRHRLDHHHLSLPLLQVADDADQRRVGGDAELGADRRAAAGRELVAVDAVVDGEEAPRVHALGAHVRRHLLGHADAGVHPARHEALRRPDAPEPLLVADDRSACSQRLQPGRCRSAGWPSSGTALLDEEAPFDWTTLTARGLLGVRLWSFLPFSSPSPLQV